VFVRQLRLGSKDSSRGLNGHRTGDRAMQSHGVKGMSKKDEISSVGLSTGETKPGAGIPVLDEVRGVSCRKVTGPREGKKGKAVTLDWGEHTATSWEVSTVLGVG